MKRILLLVNALLFSLVGSNFAGTVYVDPVNGNDNYDGRSSIFSGGLNGPNRSIQGGIDDAVSGDTVFLVKGIYDVNDNIEGKDSITIMGESRDSVIVQAQIKQTTNLYQDYVFNFITPSGSFIKELKIENLSIYKADEAAIMALRTRGFQARKITIIGDGKNSSLAPNADGIRVLESRDFILEDIILKNLAQSGLVFGGGVFNGIVRNISFENIGTGFFAGAVSMWTGAGTDVPAADINNLTFEGNLTFENCSNGFVMESETGRSISLTAGTVNSDFGLIENADILRYGVGSTPNLYNFGLDMGLNYVGELGLVQGLEALYQNLDTMLATAQNALYVNSAVCKNLQETSYYLKGNMLPNLALADITSEDSLVFFSGNFANKDIVINKEITLVSGINNTDLKSLTIDGTNIEVDVVNNFTLSSELNLDNGKLITSDNNSIFLKTGAIASGGKSTSFVSGPLYIESSSDALETLVFPIGKEDKYRPIEIWVDQSNTTPTYYKAEMINSEATAQSLEAGLGLLSPSHYWEIDQFSQNSFDELFVFIEYQAGDYIFDPASLRVAANDGANNWSNEGGSGNGTPKGRIKSNPLNDFFDIALATTEEGTSNFDPNGGGGSVGVNDVQNSISAKVFPNPSSNEIYINWTSGEYNNSLNLQIFDLNGKELIQKNNLNNNAEISIEVLSAGTYLLQLRDGDGNRVYFKKIQKF